MTSAIAAGEDGVPQRHPGAEEPTAVVVEQPDFAGASAEEALTRLGLTAVSLENGPIVRIAVIRRAPEVTLLLVAAHHIAMDGWALDMVIRRICQRYRADGDTPAAPSNSAVRQLHGNQHRHGNHRDDDLAYWRDLLTEVAPPADLPMDHPRPAVRSNRGNSVAFAIEPSVAQGIAQRAKHTNTTTFTALFTAVALLLRRLVGEEVTLGTVIANRDWPGVQDVVGLCANTIAVPTRFDDDGSIASAVSETGARLRDGYAHGGLPFTDVVESGVVTRDVRRNPST